MHSWALTLCPVLAPALTRCHCPGLGSVFPHILEAPCILRVGPPPLQTFLFQSRPVRSLLEFCVKFPLLTTLFEPQPSKTQKHRLSSCTAHAHCARGPALMEGGIPPGSSPEPRSVLLRALPSCGRIALFCPLCRLDGIVWARLSQWPIWFRWSFPLRVPAGSLECCREASSDRPPGGLKGKSDFFWALSSPLRSQLWA